MGRRYDTISLLTDYGTADEFVGVVKSVVRSLAPHVAFIDISHEVAPHDVRSGALTLMRAAQYLAPGVVLGIVDPGVGTDRRAVAVEVGGGEGVFVGPDNGLLAPAVAMAGGAERAVVLTATDYHLPAPGPTFAGRDVFAPVAAHLCNGVDLLEVGDVVDPVTLLPGVLPITTIEDGGLRGEVLWIDRFGNVQLNVDPDEIASYGDTFLVKWGESGVRRARRASTYGELSAGELGIVIDSYGLVSLAFDRLSAGEQLRLRPGDSVVLVEPS
jgi:S-adenosyl-L-methionine hydrolase (adenosine-forming)